MDKLAISVVTAIVSVLGAALACNKAAKDVRTAVVEVRRAA